MQTNINKSKSGLQKRSFKKKNDSIQRKSIFQLIKPINKKTYSWLDNNQEHFIGEFAENILSFLEKKYPKSIKNLRFEESDDINVFISKLIEIYDSLGLIVVFQSNEFNESEVKILYPIKFDFMWYVMELKYYELIKVPELKLGYLILLKKFSNACFHDPFGNNQNFENIDDNQYCSEFQYNQELFDEAIDSEVDPNDYVSFDNDEELQHFWYKKQAMNDMLNQPHSSFYNYKPKDEDEAAFKDFLILGIKKMNFSLISKLYDNEDLQTGESISFRECFISFFDMDNPIEQSYFESLSMNADNGVTEPCGYYEVKNGKIKNLTPPKMLKNLSESMNYLAELYEQFLNQL